MEEDRSFFYAQISALGEEKTVKATTKFENGGGSRAHKDYTGMYRM